MLELCGVSCGYDGREVLSDISLKIKDNECCCILGPNGCGKSTLLKAVAGLLPFKGEISIDGISTRGRRQKFLAQSFALLSQLTSVYFPYTVFEAVMMGRYIHGGIFSDSAGENADVVLDCLEKVGMAELRNRSIDSLSGGQLQRVYLARTFAQNPQIILLDEPTNHLDLRYQVELLELLKKWLVEGKRSVVAVLHDVNLALSLADRVALISDGRLAAFEGKESFPLEMLGEVYGMDVREYMRGTLARWRINDD